MAFAGVTGATSRRLMGRPGERGIVPVDEGR